MGTNFYVDAPASCGGTCPTHCRGGQVHLGKSSGGWAFAFRAYPETPGPGLPDKAPFPVTDFTSWLKLLDLGQIRNEYGLALSREELLEIVESSRGARNDLYGHDYLDAAGNRFTPGEFC